MAHAHGFATRLRDTYPQGQFVPSGKFGRMFPTLEPFLPPDSALHELGEAMKAAEPPMDNPNVPAGYTYLGQFVAHDITFDPTSVQETLIDLQAVRNFRTPGLDLDSIYGAGPVGQPYLYERDPNRTRITSDRFLIGKTNSKPGEGDPAVQTQLPFDLPRGPNGFALIADPRNDENLILAQMHLAFLRFHNRVVGQLPDDGSRFEKARQLVVWHYQWIVRYDFLPRLLDPVQLDSVLKEGRKFYCPQGEPFIPVEFAAAAYRFGHSMVRDDDDYNRVFHPSGKDRALLATNLFHFTGRSGDGTGAPIPSDWIIDWRRFFELDKSIPIGHSRQLDPFLDQALHDLPEISGSKSLAVRNLQSGKRLRLPSGQSVATVLGLRPLTPKEIRQGDDGKVAMKYGLDIETPLWYYILKEAQVCGKGQRLGPVGSRIVAEVFIGLLKLDREAFLARQPPWTPTLCVEQRPLCTMADLLKFTGDLSPIDDSRNLKNPH